VSVACTQWAWFITAVPAQAGHSATTEAPRTRRWQGRRRGARRAGKGAPGIHERARPADATEESWTAAPLRPLLLAQAATCRAAALACTPLLSAPPTAVRDSCACVALCTAAARVAGSAESPLPGSFPPSTARVLSGAVGPAASPPRCWRTRSCLARRRTRARPRARPPPSAATGVPCGACARPARSACALIGRDHVSTAAAHGGSTARFRAAHRGGGSERRRDAAPPLVLIGGCLPRTIPSFSQPFELWSPTPERQVAVLGTTTH
jgi:hypothetical protein